MMGTLSFMSIGADIEVTGIVVNDPLEWLALPMIQEKRICSFFEECMVPLYEFMFTKM